MAVNVLMYIKLCNIHPIVVTQLYTYALTLCKLNVSGLFLYGSKAVDDKSCKKGFIL